MRVDENSPVPLYHQIKLILRDTIENKMQPGDCLAPENELAEQHGVSRTTIRKAILDLVAEGRLYRKRGKGTFVARPKIVRPVTGLTSFSEDMKMSGVRPGHRFIDLRVVEASAKVSNELTIAAGEKVIQLKRLMLANDEPIAFHTSYIPRKLWDSLKGTQAIYSDSSLYSLLEGINGIALDEAIETIDAILADEISAKYLGVEEGSPLILTERTTLSNDKPIEYAIHIYRADRYKYQLRNKRNKTVAQRTFISPIS